MTCYRIQRTDIQIETDDAGRFRCLHRTSDHSDAAPIDRLDVITHGSIHDDAHGTLHVDANVIVELAGYLHERYPKEGGNKLRSRLDKMFVASPLWPEMLRGTICAHYPDARTPGDVGYFKARAAGQLSASVIGEARPRTAQS